MIKLITLTLIVGFILAIANLYFLYIDVILLSALTFLPLLVLIFVNLILIFAMWHDYKYFSFVPFAISLLFLPLIVLFGFIGNKIGMYSNPSYPNKYFNEEREKELTAIAEELLQAKDERDVQAIKEKLRNHHLFVRNINRYSNIVEFNYYRPRIMFAYIFAKDGLPEIYSATPVITEEDISSWAELVNIFNPKNSPSNYGRGEVVFVPEIAYPYLIKNLDKVFVDKVAAMESYHHFIMRNNIKPHLDPTGKRHAEYLNSIAGDLSKEEKLKVIEILNRQCRISSGLVEDSNISGTFKWKFLHIPGTGGFDTRSQVGKHFKQLISDGVISFKDSEGHLQLKSNLNDQEIREIEWLQVEIMRFVYGNLIRKTEYWSNEKTKLSDNWYFYNIR
jgi:hypothetical protein